MKMSNLTGIQANILSLAKAIRLGEDEKVIKNCIADIGFAYDDAMTSLDKYGFVPFEEVPVGAYLQKVGGYVDAIELDEPYIAPCTIFIYNNGVIAAQAIGENCVIRCFQRTDSPGRNNRNLAKIIADSILYSGKVFEAE